MGVAAGGVTDAGEKEGHRRMPIIHASSTAWPNRRNLQENVRRERPSCGGNRVQKKHICNNLSPLKQQYSFRRYQCTYPATSHFKNCQSSSVTSLSRLNPSPLKEYLPASNSRNNPKALYVSESTILSKSSECMEDVSRTEETQSSSLQRHHSGISFPKFAPLQSIGVTCEVEANSAERNVDEDKEGKNDNEESIFGEVVTNELLRKWTGFEDLFSVSIAEFRLDTRTLTGVDTISERMPHIHSLKLNNSYIPHVRMLGTKFMMLKRLWIGSSQVETLRGIGACAPALEELYASFNSVHDITPLLDVSETLEVVDLEGNDIRDASSLIRSLKLLKKVKYLTLQGNPVVMDPLALVPSMDVMDNEFATSSFRDIVQTLMPDLQYLDDMPVTLNEGLEVTESSLNSTCGGNSRRSCTHVDPLNVSLSDEYMFLQQCIRECGFDELEAAVVEATRGVYTRPQTSCGKTRPQCSTSASSQGSQRPHSSSHTVDRLLTSLNSNISSGGRWPPFVGGGQINPSPPTLSLRTDRAVKGGALRFCHRLPPLQTTTTAANVRVDGYHSNSNQIDTSGSRGRSNGYCTPGANVLPSSSPAAEVSVKTAGKEVEPCPLDENPEFSSSSLVHVEDAIDTPLFDEADDEWEIYKKSFLRRMDSRGATMQRWSKYMVSESAISSHGGHESRGLSAISPSVSSLTPSACSGPPFLQTPQKEQETEHEDVINTRLIADSKLNEEEETAWQQELMRSVARSRTKTARAASDKERLRVIGESTPEDVQLTKFKILEGNDIKPSSE
ncbi:hypothetical protein MOQ_004748 [Trypanosoma cruzi marinkellei]|uniref:Leucine-rich repeat protein (LRRP) n=1 Tax=Trypanosoma cruzi marinkellei TaxID=85056 RepID=K2NR56_TRYCR|nr:hypothetical protein MOQ_004748 [Trypanosoma cruzi marinkellei]